MVFILQDLTATEMFTEGYGDLHTFAQKRMKTPQEFMHIDLKPHGNLFKGVCTVSWRNLFFNQG
jgi:hypothetical protein